MSRLAITAALDALEAGDQDHAVAILLGALEDSPVSDPHGRRRPCPECGPPLRWPGELEHHRRVSHAGCLDPPARRSRRTDRRTVRPQPGGRR